MQSPRAVLELVEKSLRGRPDWSEIRHVTKVDPEKGLDPSDRQYLRGTDAVMVGGSDGVTAENTREVLETLDGLDVPVLLEPYTASHVGEENFFAADYTAVAAVWNGDDRSFKGKHRSFFGGDIPERRERLHDRIERALSLLPGDERLASAAKTLVDGGIDAKFLRELYVVQNPEAAVADLTGATDPLSPEAVGEVAGTVEHYYDNFDVLYVEYSGTYGDPEDVRRAAERLESAVLLYGGGIETAEQTREMLDAGADAVVVGDSFHEDPEAFRATIPE